MSPPPQPGTLYLLPNHLGEGGEGVLPAYLAAYALEIQYYLAEEERAARGLLAKLWRSTGLHGKALSDKQSSIHLELLNEHTTPNELTDLLQPLWRGNSMAIVSEAGMPAIADPGADAVKAAHRMGARVVPLVGPNSLLLALAGSGLGGQRFAFWGYLPKSGPEVVKELKKLELRALAEKAPQLFIEAPYRNKQLLELLLKHLRPDTLLTVATDLTLPGEFLKTRAVREWQKNPLPDIQRRPTVFIVGS